MITDALAIQNLNRQSSGKFISGAFSEIDVFPPAALISYWSFKVPAVGRVGKPRYSVFYGAAPTLIHSNTTHP